MILPLFVLPFHLVRPGRDIPNMLRAEKRLSLLFHRKSEMHLLDLSPNFHRRWPSKDRSPVAGLCRLVRPPRAVAARKSKERNYHRDVGFHAHSVTDEAAELQFSRLAIS